MVAIGGSVSLGATTAEVRGDPAQLAVMSTKAITAGGIQGCVRIGDAPGKGFKGSDRLSGEVNAFRLGNGAHGLFAFTFGLKSAGVRVPPRALGRGLCAIRPATLKLEGVEAEPGE